MKVTAYRIAQSGYDAMIIGFDRPCVISLYKRNVSPLCGSGAENDEKVFRYASHVEGDTQKNMNPKDYTYVDGLTIFDFYEYFSTIDLSHLTHEQHKAMYTAVAEINDVTSRCDVSFPPERIDEELECKQEIKRTDVIEINLKKCYLKFADGSKATYDELH